MVIFSSRSGRSCSICCSFVARVDEVVVAAVRASVCCWSWEWRSVSGARRLVVESRGVVELEGGGGGHNVIVFKSAITASLVESPFSLSDCWVIGKKGLMVGPVLEAENNVGLDGISACAITKRPERGVVVWRLVGCGIGDLPSLLPFVCRVRFLRVLYDKL